MAWTCDLFVRTYWRDLAWLALCLEAIARYCEGFRHVVVVTPESDAPWLRRAELPGDAQFVTTSNFRDDYLGQQVSKLSADTITDADFICHIDADCIFSRVTTPGDLIDDDRPLVTMRPSSQLGRHYPWRKVTEDFLGWSVPYDFMQRPPFTYPRWLYSDVRAHARRTHGVSIETYVTSRPPRGFSEFNVLGAFAWKHHRDSFVWHDASTGAAAEPFCRWYWSWGGLDTSIRREIESILDAAPQQRSLAR